MSHVIAPFRGIRYIPPFLYSHSNARVIPLVNTPESMCVDLLSTWVLPRWGVGNLVSLS